MSLDVIQDDTCGAQTARSSSVTDSDRSRSAACNQSARLRENSRSGGFQDPSACDVPALPAVSQGKKTVNPLLQQHCLSPLPSLVHLSVCLSGKNRFWKDPPRRKFGPSQFFFSLKSEWDVLEALFDVVFDAVALKKLNATTQMDFILACLLV